MIKATTKMSLSETQTAKRNIMINKEVRKTTVK